MMTKKIFTQIKNEWRSNIWLALELLVVSVVLWYIVDYLYIQYITYTTPRGFDTEHCYKINFAYLPETSHEFDSMADNTEAKRVMLDRVAAMPFVEAAAFSSNAHPYNTSNNGITLSVDTFFTYGFNINRIVTPDFVKVFRYSGVNGETPEKLAEILRRGDLLVSDNSFSRYGIHTSELVGQRAIVHRDSSFTIKIGASLNVVRYSDYWLWMQESATWSPSWAISSCNEFVFRVKENMDSPDIPDRIMEIADKQLRAGNIYVTSVVPFSDIRTNFQREATNNIRNYIVVMAFLLLNIFLGLLGTFWFRTQQRVNEIAIRKVNGANNLSIFCRMIGEGLIILSIATIPAVCIDVILAKFEFNAWYLGEYFNPGRIELCAGISYLLMSLMIIVGIAIPARRAMSVEPAVTLRSE